MIIFFNKIQSQCHETFAISIDFNVYANGHAIYVYVSDGFICSLTHTHTYMNAYHCVPYVFAQHRAGFILRRKFSLKFVSRDLPTDRSKINVVFTIRGSAQMETTISREWCVYFVHFFSLYIHSFPELLFIYYYYYYCSYCV